MAIIVGTCGVDPMLTVDSDFASPLIPATTESVMPEVYRNCANQLVAVTLSMFAGCAVDTRKGFRGRAANENVDEAQRKKANLLLRRWETSLLSATSLSQVSSFLLCRKLVS